MRRPNPSEKQFRLKPGLSFHGPSGRRLAQSLAKLSSHPSRTDILHLDPEWRLLVGVVSKTCLLVGKISTWQSNQRAVIGRLMENFLFCIRSKFTNESSTRTTASRETRNFQATFFHEDRA
jgi:hypothetical protein